MDYPTRYPKRSNSDTSMAIFIASPDYHSNFKAHWHDNMNSQQQLQSKMHLLGGSFDENKQNHNFGKIYSTKQSLSVDSMPRRESLWQSLTKSATNLLGRHLNGTTSILKNWSSMNTPLSVTVVSPDLYKSLQANKDHQMVTPSKGFFDSSAWTFKEAPNETSDLVVDALPGDLYNAEIVGDCPKKDSDTSDTEKRWNDYKNMYVNCNDLKAKDQDACVDRVNCSQNMDKPVEEHFGFSDLKKDLDSSANFGNTVRIDDEPVMLEKPESPLPQTQQQPEPKTLKPSGSMVNALLTTYNKVVNGAADLLQLRSTSPDLALFKKRSCSPKPRPKKQHLASVFRGRGRGRPQLRRSGVSQKRHRKARGKHAVEQDIKNDIDTWEELEYCNTTDDEQQKQQQQQFEDVDECDYVTAIPKSDVAQRICTPRKCEWIEFEVNCKPTKCEWVEFESSSSEDEDSEDEVDECEEKNSFRSRLNSCNSEDSYCIIFDDDASEETSEPESLDDEFESESEVEYASKKVRFNPIPTVHRMIAWKFAYKAARQNQDLINKDHFRARIARTGRALDPVLKPQFRDRIYHERFEE